MNIIMKKNHLFLATAIVALAGCSDNTYMGDLEGGGPENMPISFNMNTPAMTRAADKTGSDAAADLNNRFVIWGEKNEAGSGAAASDANIVFKNYKVEYTASTAYNTTSNTKDWEYVGLTPYTQVTPYLSTTQTIKYWDYAATKYTFTAVSALDADITGGKVVIGKNTSDGTSSSDFNKGYDIEVITGASLDKIFVADRNVINQGSGTDRTATNAYGGNVTMRFRNFMSKIRFGIYETIPGYKVKITKVYYNSTESTTNFGVDGKFLTVGDGSSTHTKFTVTYENSTNKAVVDVKSGTTPVSGSYFETAPGTVSSTVTSVPFLSADYIGTTAPGATFNKTVKEGDAAPVNGVYTTIIPFSSNDTNIKLKIDYQLISEDTGETINISGKTAEVPAAYCQWKSNYAYSYIFKITDDGLYPITFDAVEVVDENGTAEYITTVTEPSITTFGVKSSVYSSGKDEYETGTDIYATIVEGHAVVSPTDKYFVYTVTAGATEAQVAEAIAEKGMGRVTTPAITCTAYTTNVSVVTSVPAEDGGTKTVTGAIKMQSPAAATYAVAYKVSAGSATATTAAYDASTTYYSMTPTAEGFYPIATPSAAQISDWATAKTNFTTAPTQPVYVYKVIKVATAP